MPRETVSTRVTRLENAMAELTERVNRISEKVEILIDAQIKTEEHFRRTDERMKSQGQQMDERIEKLVSAIGEFIRRNSKL